jgi:hypothetical protein
MPLNKGLGPHTVSPEPWRSFLSDLDELIKATVELCCIGGFVVAGSRSARDQFVDLVASHMTLTPPRSPVDRGASRNGQVAHKVGSESVT